MKRYIDVDWPFHGDPDTPARYISQLADALWRHENCENFATLAPLVVACQAVAGNQDARRELDTNEAWHAAAVIAARQRRSAAPSPRPRCVVCDDQGCPHCPGVDSMAEPDTRPAVTPGAAGSAAASRGLNSATDSREGTA